MATSDIDQKILCQVARDTQSQNPLLSSALYQTLGLSIMLSYKLYRAESMRRLDTTRDTHSLALYHQIIWLSREGLAITEVLILPYCQAASHDPRCRVMAAKLRATFYHIFCLYHNQPPISQLAPPKTSPSDKTIPNQIGGTEPAADPQTRRALLRETIPSMVSETSYVTNPYANHGPAQSSPPPYPPPPIPQMQKPLPTTPLQPAAWLKAASPAQRSPPSSADFIMPSINFVPAATAYFSQAGVLAKRLLPGANPLRLSIALETCAFTWECGKDFALAKHKAKTTLHDAYSAPELIDDAEFEDAATLVAAIISIAKRNDSAQVSSGLEIAMRQFSPRSSASNSPTRKQVPRTPPARSPRPRRSRSQQSQKSMQPSSRKLGKMPATTTTKTELSTPEVSVERLVEREIPSNRPPMASSGPPPEERLPTLPSGQSPAGRKSPRHPRATSKTSRQSRDGSARETAMSEKERKRRIVEEAEERLRRRRESQSQASSTSANPGKQRTV